MVLTLRWTFQVALTLKINYYEYSVGDTLKAIFRCKNENYRARELFCGPAFLYYLWFLVFFSFCF